MSCAAHNLGFGLGLRAPHYTHFLEQRPASVGWLEIISENYLHAHPGYWRMLADLRHDYPMAMHGVALSIGSTDALDESYLRDLRKLADFIEPAQISDHLCYTGVGGEFTHDLLPIPYTEEALRHVVARTHHVQETLGRRIVFENASSYLEWNGQTLTEAEFLTELTRATGCGILLDVNNVYVASRNHGWDATAYIRAIPSAAITQYHLAGHSDHGAYLIDTHDAPVADSVWQLFHYTLQIHGPRSTMIEWDEAIPEFSVLEAELEKAKRHAESAERNTV